MARLLRAKTLAWSLPALSLALVVVTMLVLWLAPAWRPGTQLAPLLGYLALPLAFPVVGALVAGREPANPVGWLFGAIGVVGGVQVAASAVVLVEPALPGRDWAAWLTSWLDAVALGGLGAALLYFPDGRLPSRRWWAVVWLLALAVAGLLVAVGSQRELVGSAGIANPLGISLPGGRRPYEAVYYSSWLLLWAGIIAAVSSLLTRFSRARGERRQQLKWLAFAATLLGTLGVLTIVAYYLGVRSLVVFAGLGLLAIPVAVGIAIGRHRLYDIDVLINRTLVYGLLTVVLGACYAATVLLLGAGLGEQVLKDPGAASAATLVAAIAFRPVRRRIQAGVDRRFNRRKYDAARTIEAFGTRLRRLVDLDALISELEAVVDETMQPTSSSLLLRPLEPEAAPGPGGIAGDDLLLSGVHWSGRPVEVDALQLDSAALRELRAAGARLVVPLIGQGELVGLLHLGPRRGGRPYSADDRALLGDLASQAAPAVRLAQLVRRQQDEVRERERIDHELHVAQLIQQRFLPPAPPDLPGWHLAALYRPAQAVGGDFYDFISLPGGRVGIVVGDVTDKGMPAALVMATTHGILRAEAPRLVAPHRVLERANDLLLGETFEHMFVTCLYAVLDPASGRLSFANAGHNLPYLRGEAGVAELRATGMPLGLLPGQRYEEQFATVAPGDDLLLYSDGLTEAHGPDREMFGFPRLTELVGGGAGGQELIDRLLAELAAFTGPGWEQEDDITLVALRRAPAASMAAAPAGAAGRVLTQFEAPSEAGNERLVIDRVVAAVSPLGLPQDRLERLGTAVGEAARNAIEHGNANNPELPVAVRVVTHEGNLLVQVTDHGGGRPIPEPATPDLAAKLAGEQSPRGWGLFLIQNMVDELHTTSDARHHTVELVMHLDARGVGGTHKEEG
jgi:serine phosphatase RsbU (regulator of sigma subunit)/anti-sigma regulatory factor (Ser/Thr protein kinase)